MYWSPAIQAACFSLPKFASDALLQVEEENARHLPALDLPPLAPCALRERFRLASDKFLVASNSMGSGMGVKVSPHHRPLFASEA